MTSCFRKSLVCGFSIKTVIVANLEYPAFTEQARYDEAEKVEFADHGKNVGSAY